MGRTYEMKNLITTVIFICITYANAGKAKEVAFINHASSAAEWVYFSGPSTAAEWVYLSGASTAAEWIYITNSPTSADYTICFPRNFDYTKKHIAAIYITVLKK